MPSTEQDITDKLDQVYQDASEISELRKLAKDEFLIFFTLLPVTLLLAYEVKVNPHLLTEIATFVSAMIITASGTAMVKNLSKAAGMESDAHLKNKQ